MNDITNTAGEIIGAGERSVPELARQINEKVRAAENNARSAVQNALEAGQLLNEAKRQVPHGKWSAWLAEHITVAPRTAQAYMRLANKVPALPDQKRNAVADLPLREAMAAIATDPAPPTRAPAAQPPRDREQRDRVVDQFQSTAKSIREAAKWFGYNMALKPQKVATLRKKLQDALAELDRMQQEGGAQ